MTAANAIAEADKLVSLLRIDGDRLALKGGARPSDELLAKAQRSKRSAVTILRRKASGTGVLIDGRPGPRNRVCPNSLKAAKFEYELIWVGMADDRRYRPRADYSPA